MEEIDFLEDVEFKSINYLMVKSVQPKDLAERIFQQAILRNQDRVQLYHYPYSNESELFANADLLYCCSCLNFKDLVSYTSSTNKIFIHNLPNLHSLEISTKSNDFYLCPNAKNIDRLRMLITKPDMISSTEAFANIVRDSSIKNMLVQIPSPNVWNNYMLPHLSSSSVSDITITHVSKSENDLICFRDITNLSQMVIISPYSSQLCIEMKCLKTLRQVVLYGLTYVQFTLLEQLDNFEKIVVPHNICEVGIFPTTNRNKPVRICVSTN